MSHYETDLILETISNARPTYLLTGQATQISFPIPIMCDASQTQGLMIGIAIRTL